MLAIIQKELGMFLAKIHMGEKVTQDIVKTFDKKVYCQNLLE